MSENVMSTIDCLYDEDNNDIIFLLNEKGEQIGFEQIALIPLKEKTYVILKPVEKMEGVGEDEGLMFSIEDSKDDGQEYLVLVADEKIIDDVFDIYEDLIKDEVEENENLEDEEISDNENNNNEDAEN